ncbi:adenine deaminase [Bacillus sp. 165]|uniref:adenine deaminase n=1 Tax=Bacillus sp. 165 TaxID=1529117 RepID=UPI001ADAAB05|nr:adenine deaminase [Bacillus sp. 165]
MCLVENTLVQNIEVANKQKPADLIIKNGKIINVFTQEIIEEDIAIHNGMIVGIGEFKGENVIDANGQYICPGFIDTHVHIESSMVTPSEFSQVVLPHGVTTVIADPHEIANVCGVKGIQFMLDASENIPLDVNVMLPSCVPATPFENAGAILDAAALEPFLPHPRVLGIAEVMDYPSVLNAKEDMMKKLQLAHKSRKHIDGHMAGLGVEEINVYRTAGITTDHEAVSQEEMIDRLRRGMYVQLREGSVAKNVKALLQGVTEQNARRCIFCTDDKHLDDLIDEGSIDYNVRAAIQAGISPITAIMMATLNAAECYGLRTKGAVAPGYEADLLFLSDLESVKISKVFKKGLLVAENGQYLLENQDIPRIDEVSRTVSVPDITKESLQLPIVTEEAHIIEINPNSLITNHLIEKVNVQNGFFAPSTANDQLKIVVVERHKKTGNIGIGVVKGFQIQSGAIASTVAHDSHNIVVAGTSDEDILKAIHTITEMQGGLAVIQNEQVIASLSLPIAGLMSPLHYTEVYKDIQRLNEALITVGAATEFNAFLTLSFLSLPVIPKLKITDIGLFDVTTFTHISV